MGRSTDAVVGLWMSSPLGSTRSARSQKGARGALPAPGVLCSSCLALGMLLCCPCVLEKNHHVSVPASQQSVHCIAHPESRRGEGRAREQNKLCLQADGVWSCALGLGCLCLGVRKAGEMPGRRRGLGCWSCCLWLPKGFVVAAQARLVRM